MGLRQVCVRVSCAVLGIARFVFLIKQINTPIHGGFLLISLSHARSG